MINNAHFLHPPDTTLIRSGLSPPEGIIEGPSVGDTSIVVRVGDDCVVKDLVLLQQPDQVPHPLVNASHHAAAQPPRPVPDVVTLLQMSRMGQQRVMRRRVREIQEERLAVLILDVPLHHPERLGVEQVRDVSLIIPVGLITTPEVISASPSLLCPGVQSTA